MSFFFCRFVIEFCVIDIITGIEACSVSFICVCDFKWIAKTVDRPTDTHEQNGAKAIEVDVNDNPIGANGVAPLLVALKVEAMID
jgi:hypothetical protein